MKKTIISGLAIIIISLFTLSTLSAQEKVSKLVNLNESNFTAKTKSGLILVDFYADWCRPCKLMKPILEEVASDYESKLTIAVVNTDFNKNLSTRYNVSGIPCLVLLKDGKEVKRIIGYREKADLVKELSSYLN